MTSPSLVFVSTSLALFLILLCYSLPLSNISRRLPITTTTRHRSLVSSSQPTPCGRQPQWTLSRGLKQHSFVYNFEVHLFGIGFFLSCRHLYPAPHLTFTFASSQVAYVQNESHELLSQTLLALPQWRLRRVLSRPRQNHGNDPSHICFSHLSHPITTSRFSLPFSITWASPIFSLVLPLPNSKMLLSLACPASIISQMVLSYLLWPQL